MIDVIMLALMKKYSSGSGAVSQADIEKAVEKYMETHPSTIEEIQVNGVNQENNNGVINLDIPEIESIPVETIKGLFT